MSLETTYSVHIYIKYIIHTHITGLSNLTYWKVLQRIQNEEILEF